MNKKYRAYFLGASLLYIIYHLVTLAYSPIPWFDEVCFGSITESYMKDHTFYMDARNILLPAQIFNYGPIYFMLQSAILKVIGFGIFNFRLNNLCFGFIDLFLVYKVCRHLKFSVNAAVLTLVFIGLEPNFNQFLHSGRMDFVALFFFLLSYLVFIKASADANKRAYILYGVATGILLACAMLTNPRIIFAFSFYACYCLYELIQNKDSRLLILGKYIAIAVPFILLNYAWIYSAYGSISNYIHINSEAGMKDHIGLSTYVRPTYIVALFAYSFVVLLVLLVRKMVFKNMPLILFTVPVIISFLALVSGGISGRYFALAIPFVAILIVGTTISLLQTPVLKYATYFTMAAFVVVFVFKGAFILSTLGQHDPYKNEKAISKYLTPNTTIIGEFRYFYMAHDNNCRFLSLRENGLIPNEVKYIIDHKVDYFIISKDDQVKGEWEQLLLNEHYTLIGEVDDAEAPGYLSKIIKKLPYRINDSYSCYIYKYKG